eukprot:TRINITY_DN6592_c0_g3_i1.p2 TRINITY_DN6592_c0_g3~~TRINITY_DN6592_c0_g3_i1.p2  ORF type:complete len:205 (-),score=25.58 TRINITY_DN6592_c0_g3_i1:276-890(-)
MDVLHTLLKKLIYQSDNEEDDLPSINFENVIILGHSMGGAFSYIYVTGDKTIQFDEKFLPDIKEEFWDEYVKGVILFEAWSEEYLLMPTNNKFLIFTGSEYYEEIFLAEQSYLTDEDKSQINFYVIYDTNHYLINNFHGPEQVVPGAPLAEGQENFTTTFQEWERGQDAYVKLLDYEIQIRLDDNLQAQNLLSTLLENEYIEKI